MILNIKICSSQCNSSNLNSSYWTELHNKEGNSTVSLSRTTYFGSKFDFKVLIYFEIWQQHSAIVQTGGMVNSGLLLGTIGHIPTSTHVWFVAPQTHLQHYKPHMSHMQVFTALLISSGGFCWHWENLHQEKEMQHVAEACVTHDWSGVGHSPAPAAGLALHAWIATAGSPGSLQDPS